MSKMVNPLFTEYKLVCQHPGCYGKKLIEMAQSAGWTVGQVLPEDQSHPDVGRCPVCKRHKMKVVAGPPAPAEVKPKGWTRIPEK